MKDEEMKRLPPAAIDTFRANILADAQDLDLPQDVQRWAEKLQESCREPGGFTIFINFESDECVMGIVSCQEADKREPEALYIHFTLETIGQLIRVLKLAEKEMENAERRRRAVEVMEALNHGDPYR